MYKKLLFLLVLLCAAANAQQLNKTQQALNNAGKSFFIQNKGQWNSEVKYLARIGGMNVWITNSGVVYDYYRITKKPVETKTKKMNRLQKMIDENKNTTIQGHVVKMQLVNVEKDVIYAGNNQREGYYNYFIGNDQSKWASNVPLYDNVELQGVYKNIDVKYYYDNGLLRYDYKAKLGADLSQIKLRFDGQEGISINSNGELILKTSLGEVTNGKIYAYQMEGETQKEVECKFEQRENGSIGFKAGEYDAKKELIIDPLVYSTFIGESVNFEGDRGDWGNAIAIDVSGNAYITGITTSSNYPTTSGAYQTTFLSGMDAFVTKLNSTGSALVYSTYLGGSSSYNRWGIGHLATSIAIDAIGNAYITGGTLSSNYPTTSGAYQTSGGGGFVTKLNSTGSALVYSTYVGGDTTVGLSIAIDTSGNAYITGLTQSLNYPTTSGAYQTTNIGGGQDGFITKLNPTGSALVYSTFIGEPDVQENSIAIDASGDAYITGETWSSNYPTTSGAFQASYPGTVYYEGDHTGVAFVTKLNSTGSALVYSTFIGGSGNSNIGDVGDEGNSIALDANGNAYITGYTVSTNFPITNGAYQTTLGSSNGNAFITKLNSNGSNLVYSTYIGGDSSEFGNSIAIDTSGNAYITGTTTSSNYLTHLHQTTFGSGDAFVTKLNSSGNGLAYSNYIGGDSTVGSSIALDTSDNVYIAGVTTSSNYPTTSGAYQTTFGGQCDGFVTKLNISTLVQAPDWLQYTISNSGLPNNHVWGVTIDSSRNKWIGTMGGGLAKFDGTTWTVYNTLNSGLPSDSVYSISLDRSGNKWIGTTSGLVKFDGTTWTVYNTSNSGLPINNAGLAIVDGSGNMWIGTIGGGLVKFNGITWTVYNTTNSGLRNNTVWGVAVDGSGNKWVGTDGGGLARYNDTIWTVYNTSNSGLPDNRIIQIVVDGSGNLWIGTGGGLARYNDTTWTVYNTSNSGLPNNWAQYITVDGSGNKWIGTLGGLAKFDGTSWVVFTTSNSSLPSNKVNQIAIDGSGNKWMGTSAGLSVYKEGGVVTSVKEITSKNIPEAFVLFQNYPNPFNPTTTLRYALPTDSKVTLKVYNVLGQIVTTLTNGVVSAGYRSAEWNATNVASGVYFYRIEATSIGDLSKTFMQVKKMVLMK
ncbi:MAG: SBBP repeat-containing protein [Bacteroidota bacterium]